MKKRVVCLIFGMLLLVSGCGVQNTDMLCEGVYIAADSADGLHQMALQLFPREGRFIFNYDPLSSYFTTGTIELDADKLTAATDDGRFTYIFRIVDNKTVCFVQNGSHEIITVEGENPVPDGTVFRWDHARE